MPVSVQLARRWGQNAAGSTVDVDDEQGQWLINNGYGSAKGTTYTPPSAGAPGQDGPDPTISTVPPRPETQRPPRRENQALPVDGAPPQYNQGINPEAYAEFKRSRTSGSARLAETGSAYLPGGEGPQRAGKRVPAADSSGARASGGDAPATSSSPATRSGNDKDPAATNATGSKRKTSDS